MHAAIRPVFMASIAFAGAGIIATAPFTPTLPDVQIPSITTPALELAAMPSYFEWVQAATDALTYQLPTLQQIIESGVDGLLPVVEQLMEHAFPDVATFTTGLVETGTVPSSPLQDAIKLIIGTQTVAGDTSVIPDFVQGLAEVVQGIADFASHAVQPVITAVLNLTVAALTRLTETLRVSVTDIPQIAFTAVQAAGSVLGTLIENVKLVAEATVSADPAAILKATADGLADVQHALVQQAVKVVDAVNKYVVDFATALAIPQWLPVPPKSQPGTAVTPPAASVVPKAPSSPSAARTTAGGSGFGTSNPAAAEKSADKPADGRSGAATDSADGTTAGQQGATDQVGPSPDAPTTSGSTDSRESNNHSASPNKAKGKGGSKRQSAKRDSES